ncbi:hypothetical protein E2C01_086349 [Portunus trituberculatus]|uniref:Uncharacterized protein n=1 Tax=Portunus trituberculatus TaxID=210409 RepID=A0A5B7J566_PORTR|nr:hypothetical protein [Portunus trituberculatus]
MSLLRFSTTTTTPCCTRSSNITNHTLSSFYSSNSCNFSYHSLYFLPLICLSVSSYHLSSRSADYYTEFFDEHFAQVEQNPALLSQDILSAAILAGYPVPLITDRVRITPGAGAKRVPDEKPPRPALGGTSRPGPQRLSPQRPSISRPEPAGREPGERPLRRR